MNQEARLYQNVIIYYFSGTGNARNTAAWIAQEARNIGIDAVLRDIARCDPAAIDAPGPRTLVGFCSPTHGFDYPGVMRKFIRRFPGGGKSSAFLLNTRAGMRIGRMVVPGLSGVLHYKSSLILLCKGFRIVGLYPVDLPSNWLSVHPALREKGIAFLYGKTEPKVRRFARTVLSGKRNFRALGDILQDIIISPVSVLYQLGGKYALSKTFFASRECTMCGLCSQKCPVEAIRKVRGRMFWTFRCESCMKCMNECPVAAVQTAHGFMTVLYGLACVLIYFAQRALVPQVPEGGAFFLSATLGILFLFPGYRLMHGLLRFKPMERIITRSSLTSYKFWGRYKGPVQPRPADPDE